MFPVEFSRLSLKPACIQILAFFRRQRAFEDRLPVGETPETRDDVTMAFGPVKTRGQIVAMQCDRLFLILQRLGMRERQKHEQAEVLW
ncbi:hypothetical protein [Nitratireductor rhodophyticola]|uniref:hypothetical protein n=1 Tax=Nitratireductor rhodophyticola TaxID=2854036 RepID=UPI0032D8ED90